MVKIRELPGRAAERASFQLLLQANKNILAPDFAPVPAPAASKRERSNGREAAAAAAESRRERSSEREAAIELEREREAVIEYRRERETAAESRREREAAAESRIPRKPDVVYDEESSGRYIYRHGMREDKHGDLLPRRDPLPPLFGAASSSRQLLGSYQEIRQNLETFQRDPVLGQGRSNFLDHAPTAGLSAQSERLPTGAPPAGLGAQSERLPTGAPPAGLGAQSERLSAGAPSAGLSAQSERLSAGAAPAGLGAQSERLSAGGRPANPKRTMLDTLQITSSKPAGSGLLGVLGAALCGPSLCGGGKPSDALAIFDPALAPERRPARMDVSAFNGAAGDADDGSS